MRPIRRFQGFYLRILCLLVMTLVLGCARNQVRMESYEALPTSSQNRVQTAVQQYIQCSIQKVLELDDGQRHVGRLAWTASESCVLNKNKIIHAMVQGGTTNEAAFSYASDMQVKATAAAITAAQNKRSNNR